MSYKLGHTLHTVTITFVCCEGLRGKMLDEISALKVQLLGDKDGNNHREEPQGCLHYVSDLSWKHDETPL